MRKVMHVILWINIIFFFFCAFIQYSKENYNIIHNNRTSIQITKPEDMDNYTFVESINRICSDNKVDLYYETVHDALDIRPKYCIYKTNVNADFIDIPLKGKDTCILQQGESCSTLNNNKEYSYKIIGSSLLNNIYIFRFDEIISFNLENCVYYTDNNMVQILTSVLVQNGYEVSIINSNSKEVLPSWFYNQIILMLLFFISTIFYFFSLGREIVIKKLSGYGNFPILIEEIIPILLSTLLCILISLIILIMFMLRFYRDSIMNYLTYMILPIFCIVVSVLLIFAISGIYIFTQKNACDIKGKSKNIEMRIISFGIKCVVLIIALLQLSNGLGEIHTLTTLNGNYVSVKNKISNIYYLPFNVASANIDINIEYYNSQSMAFFDEIYSMYNTDDIIIADTSTYIDIDDYDTTPYCIMVNSTYLKNNLIYDLNNNKIIVSDCDLNNANVFIPDKFLNDEYTNEVLANIKNTLIEKNIELNIYCYKSDTPLYSYRIETGDKYGCIYNAIIYMPPTSILREHAISLLGGRSFMINSSSDNLYEDISEILKKYKLNNVIVEEQSAVEYYETIILSRKTSTIQSVFIALISLFIYVISIGFEISVYLVNESKRIAVMSVEGYKYSIYCSYFTELAITILIGIIILEYIEILILCLLILINLTMFSILLRKWVKRNISYTLKGDI